MTRGLSRRERERERRRSSILDAAEKVFLAKGPASATMDEVAAGAELSKGTLYLYFKSKDELYLAVILRTLGVVEEGMRAIASDTSRPGIETLRLLARHHLTFAREHRDHFRLGHAWMQAGYSIDPETRNFEDYRQLIRSLFGLTIATLQRGQADGSVRKDIDAMAFAVQMWGANFGLIMLSINQDEVARRLGQQFDMPALSESFIDLVLDGIKASNQKESLP